MNFSQAISGLVDVAEALGPGALEELEAEVDRRMRGGKLNTATVSRCRRKEQFQCEKYIQATGYMDPIENKEEIKLDGESEYWDQMVQQRLSRLKQRQR